MMVFVQRIGGAIKGLYANPQPGYAEEELPDDDAEVLAFKAPPTDDEADNLTLAAAMIGGRFEKAVAEVMRTEINILRAAVTPALPARTKAQVLAALKTAMRNGA